MAIEALGSKDPTQNGRKLGAHETEFDLMREALRAESLGNQA